MEPRSYVWGLTWSGNFEISLETEPPGVMPIYSNPWAQFVPDSTMTAQEKVPLKWTLWLGLQLSSWSLGLQGFAGLMLAFPGMSFGAKTCEYWSLHHCSLSMQSTSLCCAAQAWWRGFGVNVERLPLFNASLLRSTFSPGAVTHHLDSLALGKPFYCMSRTVHVDSSATGGPLETPSPMLCLLNFPESLTY